MFNLSDLLANRFFPNLVRHNKYIGLKKYLFIPFTLWSDFCTIFFIILKLITLCDGISSLDELNLVLFENYFCSLVDHHTDRHIYGIVYLFSITKYRGNTLT